MAVTKRIRSTPPKRPTKPLAKTAPHAPHAAALFPVVGIGASAGGLEAIEQFLRHLPANTGMAFVIVQHLDPHHKGLLAELLQKATPMKVLQVKDRTRVRPNCVYVIPPNKDMSILRGLLHLLEPAAPRGFRLPIDFFLRSLAEDRQGNAIGVILSGMGSDGTLGLRALKERAGVAFVQDPASAKFDSMPRSAIDASLADVIAPPDQLPARILAYQKHAPAISQPARHIESKTQSALEKVVIFLRAQTGQDFSQYKKSTLYRRVERRMAIHQIDAITTYVRFLQDNPQEIQILFKELLIGVTRFFRDPAAWETLQTRVLPHLLAAHPDHQPLRAWTAACSTGEEAYSLAIVLKEAIEKLKPARSISFQIFATDLDSDAIEKARTGFYPLNIAADLSPERLRRFFTEEKNGYRVNKSIRDTVTFATQNVIMDPPFTRLDLLTCRNLLIYLAPEVQKNLLSLFRYSLSPGGILFLGSAETAALPGGLFRPIDSKTRIYRRSEHTAPLEPFAFPISRPYAPPGKAEPRKTPPTPDNLQTLADRLLLQHFSPPAVLTDDRGNILYISGRTGKYLEPASGKASLNIFAMAREGLRYALTTAFHKALHQPEPVVINVAMIESNGGDARGVDITLQSVHEPDPLHGSVMIVFADRPIHHLPESKTRNSRTMPDAAHLVALQRELQQAHEQLQTTREEMQSISEEAQTSQEELKSTNEELQSTNEELQSTNEELTTSKEEMQSMNEEMQSTNHELQSKLDELSKINSDMTNLLNSTDLATVFLDDHLRIRRFTTHTTRLIHLIPSDQGRPITDITSDLIYPDLAHDVRQVLRTPVLVERPITTRDGRWFTMRVMPYRTLDDRIDGVVITFSDITESKKLEASLRQTTEQMRAVLEGIDEAYLSLDEQLIVTAFNPSALRMLNRPDSTLPGQTLRELFPDPAGRLLGDKCRQALAQKSPISFKMKLPQDAYTLRIYPLTDGLSILFQPDPPPHPAKGPSSDKEPNP